MNFVKSNSKKASHNENCTIQDHPQMMNDGGRVKRPKNLMQMISFNSFMSETSQSTHVPSWSPVQDIDEASYNFEDEHQEEDRYVTVEEEEYLQMKENSEKQNSTKFWKKSMLVKTSQKQLTHQCSSLKDLDDLNHDSRESEHSDIRYITMKEEEYFNMKEVIARNGDKNSVPSSRVQSCEVPPPLEKNHLDDDENGPFVEQLKSLALKIAECKAEKDFKDNELNLLRSQLDTNCPQAYKLVVSRNIVTSLENRLKLCQQKSYQDQNLFFIEYILHLSHLLAEYKSEIDLKDFELMKLRNKLDVKCNPSDNLGIKDSKKKSIKNWLKRRIHRAQDRT